MMFNDFFCQQCKLILNNSTLPRLITYHTEKRLSQFDINTEDIASLIRKVNPNKATVSDEISGHMLLLCEETLALPLQLIFKNILYTSKYPDVWKIANVTPRFKKGNKQLIKNYRPISLLPICGKIFEK